jgi:diketogulonate reductase-like aldo/keto reductase
MYMLHWPDSMQPGRSNRELRAESWRALEELEKLGKEPYTKLNNLNYVLIWAC